MRNSTPSLALTALALGLALSPERALAQVNAESLRPNPLREGLAGGIEASLALSRGNIELFDIGGAGRIQYQSLHPPPVVDPSNVTEESDGPPAAPVLPFVAHRVFLSASGRFSELAGRAFVSQAFVHARWTGMWHERVGSDVFAQLQLNAFLRLEMRAVGGVGVRLEAIHEPVFMLWGGTGYMLEHDRISVVEGAPDAPETLEHRWTSYVTMRLAVLEGQLLFQNSVYCQPRFDALQDFRFLEELEVMSRVGEVFMLGATLTVLYDSAPPTGVSDTDLRLVTALRLVL